MGKAPLSRRQFLQLVASGVAAEALLPLCEPALRAELAASYPGGSQDNDVHLKKRVSHLSKSYGSGDFGEWTTDAYELPCFHYTCNQTEDPLAAVPVEVAWRAPTDHTHQVGNDRILAAASNYGYVQVRQDEGGPKFLNDYHPESGLFGAGIGYLTDGEEILGTYYPGTGTSFERFFGMGYLRKQVTGKNFSVDQTIYAPFGDDPVLISEVIVTSQSPKPVNLYWIEYWGCQSYPLNYQAIKDSYNSAGELDPEKVVSLRRESAQRFFHRFHKTSDDLGLIQTAEFSPRQLPPSGGALQEELAANIPVSAPSSAPAESQPASPHAPTEDQHPVLPDTFLSSLDEGPVSFLTNAAAFFGPRNLLRHTGPAGPESVPVPEELLRPAGLAHLVPKNAATANPPSDDLSATGPESALILIKPFTLEAGQSQTLRFLYGYLPAGFTSAALIAKYRQQAPTLFAESSTRWKDEGVQFAIDNSAENESWIEREVRWHNYYLRSGFTYDDFFNEHIVSQGQVYQYCFGFQSAARDPLQHALPLVFGESRLAKEVLRYTLKSQQPDGGLPFAITGHGFPVSMQWLPSDLDLWLLWLASEYVLATRDRDFLFEKLQGSLGASTGPELTVHERLERSYRHLIDGIGVGQHGLLRGANDDWNDNIYRQSVVKGLADELRRDSESVMNAAMAAYILEHYARMLRYVGDVKDAKDVSDRASQQREAVRAQWDGRWFKRLWLGPDGGWLGVSEGPNARLWLDGQPWAILGGCATPDQTRTLIQSIDELLRKPSKIGAKQVSRKVDWPGFMPGESENGGVWAALDGPLIWALAATDPAMGYDEWKKNSRANHAEVYPGIWYGAWSGPDVYCSSDSEHAGQTAYDWGLVNEEARRRPSIYRGLSWTAWPVMNMHRHAWPLYSAAKLLGIEFTEAGLDLAPTLPRAEYSFRSRLVGLVKTARSYEGWYAPAAAGNWTIRLRFAGNETPFTSLTINGATQPVKAKSGGAIQFNGISMPDQPLRWSLARETASAPAPTSP